MAGKAFRVRIVTKYCKGCGLCVEACEKGKLYIDRRPNEQGYMPSAVRDDVDCTGCQKCAVMCPDAAIEIVRLPATTAGASAKQ